MKLNRFRFLPRLWHHLYLVDELRAAVNIRMVHSWWCLMADANSCRKNVLGRLMVFTSEACCIVGIIRIGWMFGQAKWSRGPVCCKRSAVIGHMLHSQSNLTVNQANIQFVCMLFQKCRISFSTSIKIRCQFSKGLFKMAFHFLVVFFFHNHILCIFFVFAVIFKDGQNGGP